MIRTQRTYRFLSALVVFALLFSAGMPLMEFVCGMTSQTARAMPIVALSDAISDDPCQGTADCGSLPSEVLPTVAASGLAANHSPSCCAAEAAGRAPAVVEAKMAPIRELLPVASFLVIDEFYHNSSLSFSADRGPDVISRPVSIPIRLFVSVFLL